MIVLALALILPFPTLAADFDVYVDRTNAAQGLLQLIESATDDQLQSLREAAVTADMAVLDWLSEFMLSEEFAGYPPEQQDPVYSDRYRWEHNLSVQLIALGRCQEARDRIRTLLDAAFNDAELRPVLTSAYEEAVACAVTEGQPQRTSLHIETEPVGADVFVDGARVGVSPIDHSVAVGEHEIRVEAEGYTSEGRTIVAEGETMPVGPIVLTEDARFAAPIVEPDTSPTWYEWTLWTVGVSGIATGLTLFFVARGREDTIDRPPPGFMVANLTDEMDTNDTLDIAAFASLGVGAVAAITGTVLYLTRDKDPSDDDLEQEDVSWGVIADGETTGFWLGVQFP